jgi:hypothetical protein
MADNRNPLMVAIGVCAVLGMPEAHLSAAILARQPSPRVAVHRLAAAVKRGRPMQRCRVGDRLVPCRHLMPVAWSGNRGAPESDCLDGSLMSKAEDVAYGSPYAQRRVQTSP